MLSYESVVREGDSGVLEVPISALMFPLQIYRLEG